MPRKTLFRTNGNKSAKSLPESTASTTIIHEQCITPIPTMASWTEAALEKANMAVIYDFTGAPKKAIDAYNEAIVLLDKVFESANDCIDQTRLKKIYDSYISRISILTQQLNNNELDPTPSISIPVSQLSHETPLLDPSPRATPTNLQRRSPSLNLTNSQISRDLSQSITPRSLDPFCYFSSNKIQLDSAQPPPPPPKSSKPSSGSLFGSMFLKNQPRKSQPKIPSPSPSIFSMPSPSKSTPTLSTNQPTMSWKKQSSKKKNRYSTILDPPNTESLSFSSKIELPMLTLPDVEIKKDDDYFDLRLAMSTKNFLYSNPDPMLAPMQNLHQKEKDETEKSNDHLDGNGDGFYENAGNFYENETTNTVKQEEVNTTITMEQSFSPPSSSGNATMTIKHQPPQLTSSASSTLTFNSSIYSPTSSSFYPSTYIGVDEDTLSPVSSKPPSLSHPLPLPDINFDSSTTTFSFFDGTNEHDVDTLTKYLAESAATMSSRSHRTNVSTMVPSIAAVIEEVESELSSVQYLPSTTPIPIDIPHDSHQQRSPIVLSRSTSSKSASSVKSRRSSYSLKRNKKSTTNDDVPSTPPTPTPSNSAKAISFWSKQQRSTTSSKQKTIATLPPLCVDRHTNDSTSWMVSSPPIVSQPSTPTSITSSIDHTMTSPRTSSSSSGYKRPILHSLQLPSHAFGIHATQNAINKGIDVSLTMSLISMNKHSKQPKLMARLQQSMEQGGYITDRLYVPKQLWYQKQIRLPAMDTKIATCEQLVATLERMHTITKLLDQLDLSQQDITAEALHLLGRLESILDTLGKRHHQPPPLSAADTPHGKPGTNTIISAPTTASSTISSFKDPMTAWSNKISKSVERMKIETKSSEEQINTYRSILIRLFTLTSIFEQWRDIFTELIGKVAMGKMYIYDHLLQKTMMCTGIFHKVICSFVMQDLHFLQDKWLKRNRDWLLD